MRLEEMTCEVCSGNTLSIPDGELNGYLKQVEGWEIWPGQLRDYLRLSRVYKFPDFKKGLEFVNRIGQVAEEQGHHPEITLKYGQVAVEIHTHAIRGYNRLSKNDFILAAKINELGS